MLDFGVARDYHDAVASGDLKYSDLVVLTGAGASKPCGLPDMLEFAEQFRQEVERSGATSAGAKIINAILSAEEPQTDLEGLMTTLMSLSGEGNDVAADLLFERGAEAEREQSKAIDDATAALEEWLGRVPYGEGPFDVVVSGAPALSFEIPPTIGTKPTEGFRLGEPDVAAEKFSSLAQPPFTLLIGLTKEDVMRHKKSASRARSVSEEWGDAFSSIRRAAPELLKSLKQQIQNTYSKGSLDRALIYQPLIDALMQRFSYVDIFTLNYDTVIERVLAANDKEFSTGFSRTGDRPWRNNFPESAAPGSVRLFKLHGSVNWFKVETNVVEMPVGVTGITTTAGQAQSMLIYPITHKVAYDEPHLSLLHHFSRGLRAAKICLIIGCSLRDDIVSSALAFAARDQADLKFVFCGSKARVDSNRWLTEIRERIWVMEHRFGDDGFLEELEAVLDRLARP